MKATQLLVEIENVNRYGGFETVGYFDSLRAANRKFEAFVSGLPGHLVRLRYGTVVLRDSVQEAV